uniref:Uncharacterized protein n=1 Tax=Arundo donax TaxID=35708 RepID=A0A0A8ZC02_ARUDO
MMTHEIAALLYILFPKESNMRNSHIFPCYSFSTFHLNALLHIYP